MIVITKKKDCCGCSACVQACPKQCIEMTLREGFYYPKANPNLCVDCGLCEKVCPIKHTPKRTEPVHIYAARHKDDTIIKKSSSGGVFTALATLVINYGGVVFGAGFNKDWEICHSYTETIEGLENYRRSKYAQSRIGDSYLQTLSFLKAGRLVLFTGTPCQVAGLNAFLHKKYDNLITMDVVCHGVPSPEVWREYIEQMRPKGAAGKNTVFQSLKDTPVITGISFRDKTTGWQKYGFSAWKGVVDEGGDKNTVFPPKGSRKFRHEILQENLFMRGFLQHLYLRPSCFECKFRNFCSGSDAIVADFWGINRLFPDWNDDKGVSLVVQKSEAVDSFLGDNMYLREVPNDKWDLAFKGNPSLFKDEVPSNNEVSFWNDFEKAPEDLLRLIERYTIFSTKSKCRALFDHLLLKLHIYSLIKKIIINVRKS